MTNLANSTYQELVKIGTRKDEPDVFSIIQPPDKKDSETNIILSSTAGAAVVGLSNADFNLTLVPYSSGSQQTEIYKTSIYTDKSASEVYGILGVNSVALSSRSLETEAINETAEIFSFADGYLQHDGISDLLYSKIEKLFNRYEDQATNAIKDLFDKENINLEIINESLAIIGDIIHPETSSSRLDLLEHYLFSSLHYIRDGAILGIANLNDSSAINSLKKAMDNEELSELQKDILKVISLLEKYGTPSRN